MTDASSDIDTYRALVRARRAAPAASPALARDPALWRAIDAHRVRLGETGISYVDRLARENFWTVGYATKVAQEYRRFVYLQCVCDRPLTPSGPVEQAWRLHLAYSEDYWDRFCRLVLKRPLHHAPIDDDPERAARSRRRYGETLAAYRIAFGEPPRDVWPPARRRFSPALATVRAPLRRVKRPAPLSPFLFGAAAAAYLDLRNRFDWGADEDVIFLGAAIAAAIYVCLRFAAAATHPAYPRYGRDGSNGGGSGGGDAGHGSGVGCDGGGSDGGGD